VWDWGKIVQNPPEPQRIPSRRTEMGTCRLLGSVVRRWLGCSRVLCRASLREGSKDGACVSGNLVLE